MSAIGRAYERLSYEPDVENINLLKRHVGQSRYVSTRARKGVYESEAATGRSVLGWQHLVFGTLSCPISRLLSNLSDGVDKFARCLVDDYCRTENPHCSPCLVKLGGML